MTEMGIAAAAAISIAAIVAALRMPGGCIRYSFLCGALYLAWVVPQAAALSVDGATSTDGLFWLVVMVVLCLGASLVGWRIGTMRRRSAAALGFMRGDLDVGRLFWPVAALTAFMLLLHVLIGLQPLEDRQQSNWSGPLTIMAFFLSLGVIGLYLSVLIALRERSLRSFALASVNIVLGGVGAFVALRRGPLIEFGTATTAALWFGARRRVPIWLLAAGFAGAAVVVYAIGPLRSAASEMAERTGSSAGLLSPEVWQQVDFAGEVEKAARQAPDFSNAVYLIDAANRWGEFTYGRQSWDALVFRWVPAQILGADFKSSLMFGQGMDWEKLEANYGYTTIGGTTSTGFGFAYQEFGVFGFIYFLLIGLLMGRLWSRAETGDVWAQALYASFASSALHSVTHHAMWLIVQIPLFLLAVLLLRLAAGRRARHGRPVGGDAAYRR
jgi:hypothetical protein